MSKIARSSAKSQDRRSSGNLPRCSRLGNALRFCARDRAQISPHANRRDLRVLETAKISSKVISQSQARISSSALLPKTMAKPGLRKQMRVGNSEQLTAQAFKATRAGSRGTFCTDYQNAYNSSRSAIGFRSEQFRLECLPSST